MSEPSKASVRSQIISLAQGVPSLVVMAESSDTPLADFLKGKGMAQSRTAWVVIITPLVSYLAAKYGIGWDSGTCGVISTVLVTLTALAMRTVTSAPITGFLKPAPVPGVQS